VTGTLWRRGAETATRGTRHRAARAEWWGTIHTRAGGSYNVPLLTLPFGPLLLLAAFRWRHADGRLHRRWRWCRRQCFCTISWRSAWSRGRGTGAGIRPLELRRDRVRDTDRASGGLEQQDLRPRVAEAGDRRRLL